jgi:hypothetical protein
MLNHDQAQALALAIVNEKRFVTQQIKDIVVTSLHERPKSWVAYFQSRLYVETNHPAFMIMGAGPLVIHKTLNLYAMTASFPEIEDRIEEAEEWMEDPGSAGGRSVTAYGPLPERPA